MRTLQRFHNFAAGFIIYFILFAYVLGALFCFILPFLFLQAKYAVVVLLVVIIFYRIRLPYEFNATWEIKSLRRNCLTYFLQRIQPWYTIYTSKLDSEGKYMFICCPHGMFPISWLFFLSNLANINLNPLALVADIVFRFPCMREFTLLIGGMNANWKSVKFASDKGRSLLIIPGSTREMKYSRKTKDTIIVVKRKGFIKAAYEYGYSLVPVIGVGVDELYQPYVFEWEWYKRLFGHYIFLTMGEYELFYPKKTSVYHIVGEPISVEKNLTPSEEEVAELSTKFYQALETSLEIYNKKYNKNIKLEYAPCQ